MIHDHPLQGIVIAIVVILTLPVLFLGKDPTTGDVNPDQGLLPATPTLQPSSTATSTLMPTIQVNLD
jgi:hypothetical protein